MQPKGAWRDPRGACTNMTTIFDFVTVACFLATVSAFVFLTDREPRTLAHLLVPAITFAVANQLGNGGSQPLAIILIFAGLGYAFLIVRR